MGIRRLVLIGACVALWSNLPGQSFVRSKNYPLLTLLQSTGKVRKLLEKDSVLSSIQRLRSAAFLRAFNDGNYQSIVKALQFSNDQQQLVAERLAVLYERSKALQKLVQQRLIPSGAYILYKDLSAPEQLGKAWLLDAKGLDVALAVYGAGARAHYPAIDSISFDVRRPGYRDSLRAALRGVLPKQQHHALFFSLALQAALDLLSANGRTNAGEYEPMGKTVNRKAVAKIRSTDWNDYPYSVLLVPGQGPEKYQVAISEGGKLRCRIAAKAYGQHLAPFVMVSGGRVHPYKTTYCEAEEMKRYLTDSLAVPEDAVIMEPHARHTTTNLRNAARLIFRYHIPMDKPGLITAKKNNNDYIQRMGSRCIKELGYMPYKSGKRITDTELEFYPLKDALQVNATEPLDP